MFLLQPFCSLPIIAVMKMMIGVMQVQCCVSSASDQEEHSIPIKAMQNIIQLIITCWCNPNSLPLLLANNRNNLRIILLVMLCVFEGAGINARLLDSYNCDFQVVENCMHDIWIVPIQLRSIHTMLSGYGNFRQEQQHALHVMSVLQIFPKQVIC